MPGDALLILSFQLDTTVLLDELLLRIQGLRH